MSNSNPIGKPDSEGFIPVLPTDPTKQVDSMINQGGILIFRTGDADSSSFMADECKAIFDAVAAVDPTIIIMPHNSDKTKAQYAAKHKIADVAKFSDMQCIPWGAPGENKFRGAFSFWFASNEVKPDLKHITGNTAFSELKAKLNFVMVPHMLHETASKCVGFFFGKDPTHTYKVDLVRRYHRAWRSKHSSLSNPPKCYIKRAQIKGKSQSSNAVAMYVGAKDLEKVAEVMGKQTNPMFILYSKRKEDPEAFDKTLALNNKLKDSCGAVKIEGASELFIQQVTKQVFEKFSNPQRVIDVSETAHTATTGTIYVQCLVNAKKEVERALSEMIAEYGLMTPDETPPKIVETNKEDRTTYTRQTKKTTASPTPFDYLMDIDIEKNPSLANKSNKPPARPTFRMVPAMVSTNSYANVLKGLKSNQPADDMSAGSTIKTTREQQLMEENTELKKKLQTVESELTDLKKIVTAQADQTQKLQEMLTNLMDQQGKMEAKILQQLGGATKLPAMGDFSNGTPDNTSTKIRAGGNTSTKLRSGGTAKGTSGKQLGYGSGDGYRGGYGRGGGLFSISNLQGPTGEGVEFDFFGNSNSAAIGAMAGADSVAGDSNGQSSKESTSGTQPEAGGDSTAESEKVEVGVRRQLSPTKPDDKPHGDNPMSPTSPPLKKPNQHDTPKASNTQLMESSRGTSDKQLEGTNLMGNFDAAANKEDGTSSTGATNQQ